MTGRRDSAARFRERYALSPSEASLIVDREAIGANVGANGYTTVKQADFLGECLDLGPSDVLLDIGSGRGWPGLHLAAKSGCRTILTDVPVPALMSAMERREGQDLSGLVSIVRASATSLPFPDGSFDAISHTDTL
jgi:ubiquinone/menaquinone biosynthesis C-methylase UbiE